MERRRIDRAPARASAALAVGAGMVTTITVGPYTSYALAGCGIGLAILAVGLVLSRQAVVTAGSGALVVGTILAGLLGAPPPATLVGVTISILAWDFATNALEVGEQLGRETPTLRLELVHATASSLVGFVVVAVGYLVYESTTPGQPRSAVFGLLVAVLVLLAALRRVDPLPD